MILYGVHEFKDSNIEGVYILEKEVKYKSYAIFQGKDGHLPSFPAVKIIEYYDYRNRCWPEAKMFYKIGLKRGWTWRTDEKYLVKSYCNLPSDKEISFDFYRPWEHKDYVRVIKSKNINFPGFRLAHSPRDLIGPKATKGLLYKAFTAR